MWMRGGDVKRRANGVLGRSYSRRCLDGPMHTL